MRFESRKFDAFEKAGCTRTLVVQCLRTVEDLKDICENLGLKFVDYEAPEEVEMILDHECYGLKYRYYVKWKNYSFDHCSWVPESQLKDCSEHLIFYRFLVDPPDAVDKEVVMYWYSNLLFCEPKDLLIPKLLCSLVYGLPTDDLNSLSLTENELKLKVKKIVNLPVRKLSKIYKDILKLMQYFYERRKVLLRIKEWEIEINKFNSPYVVVENQVDLQLPPLHFKFIQENVSSIVDLKSKPIIFCSCNDKCIDNKDCCWQIFDSTFAYDKQGCLVLSAGYQIFECNDLCPCSKDCPNRVVQHGQKVKVAIFRTSNLCGWGLKTLEVIKKGQFVIEYFGEVITSDEAEIRGKKYDYLGQTYLFDLDYNQECLYTIDAYHVGNASHFINHSCDPNMRVHTVFINQHDPNLPRLAFFAIRRINIGEELTFDYQMMDTRAKNGCPVPEEERIPCKCNAKNCRKYLF